MKKSKIKKLIKKARKSAKTELEGTLITLIKDAVAPLGILSKKTTKDITKAAKTLAGKLAEKLPFETAEVVTDEAEVNQKSETVLEEATKEVIKKPVRRQAPSPASTAKRPRNSSNTAPKPVESPATPTDTEVVL